MMAEAAKLETHLVTEAPSTVYYIPNFVSPKEAEYIWQKVYAAPKPKWTQLANRRLQNWGGIPHPKGMVAEKLPQWLDDCARKVATLGVFEDKLPNHVLVNEYAPGQGIMPHEDGPLYYPTVTTISLGSHTLLDFYNPISDPSEDASLKSRYHLSLFLEPGSLLVEDTVSDKIANLGHLGNPVNIGDTFGRNTRVSLTIRHVPKTVGVKLKLGK